MFEFLWELLQGFLIGNCVIAFFIYIEYWNKHHQTGKSLGIKKHNLH